jgi:hypothetical protein
MRRSYKRLLAPGKRSDYRKLAYLEITNEDSDGYLYPVNAPVDAIGRIPSDLLPL